MSLKLYANRTYELSGEQVRDLDGAAGLRWPTQPRAWAVWIGAT